MSHACVTVVATLISLVISSAAVGQSYDLGWHTIDGGGQKFTQSASGKYVLSGTIGQPDTGTLTNQTYTLKGAFWPVVLRGTVQRPIPEDCATVRDGKRCNDNGTCTTDADCWRESHCVITPGTDPPEGVCYAPKLRYLSIARHPDQVFFTARRVRFDDGTGLGWVGEAEFVESLQEPTGFWLATIQATPHYEFTWPETVHVTGCEIAHASLSNVTGAHCLPNAPPEGEDCAQHSYHIQAIRHGLDPADEGNYSEVLELRTNSTWGDMVSTIISDNGRPPDGIVGIEDIMAAIKKYQIVDVAPVVWLDIDPSTANNMPDQVIGVGDIMNCINGYQGGTYPGWGPLNCP